MALAQAQPGGDPGKTQRQLAQRDGEGGDRAAVGGARGLAQIGAGGGGQCGGHLAHHRVAGLQVATHELGRVAARSARQQAAHADKAGMLARAVVVQRLGLAALARQGFERAVKAGPVAAAFECCVSQTRLGQHGGSGGHMAGLAAVRGAGQRQFLVTQIERIGGAAGHQRQGLQHLAGRAWKHRSRQVAQPQHQVAVGIDDGQCAAVARLDGAAAQRVDQFGRRR